MACVSDQIVASPFSLIGSIGVIASNLNFSDRMEREGVIVEDVTAGAYKRTMTPYKKTTEEDRAKVAEELSLIHKQFKEHIIANRPSIVDIDKVATGEVWTATEAKKLGLVDVLATSDDLVLSLRKRGYEIFRLRLRAKRHSTGWSDMFGGGGGDMTARMEEVANSVNWVTRLLARVGMERPSSNALLQQTVKPEI